jgi:hypothetical protein
MLARYALLAAALATLALLAAGCRAGEEAAPPPAAPEGPPPPVQVSYDARFAMRQGPRPRAFLRAGRMERYETEDSLYTLLLPDTQATPPPALPPGRVRAQLFDAAGDSSATLFADRLRHLEREERFEAFGRVVVTTVTGKRLETEYLTWEEARREIRTPAFVRITTPTEIVAGNGLVADESLETYQIGRFSAEVEVEE